MPDARHIALDRQDLIHLHGAIQLLDDERAERLECVLDDVIHNTTGDDFTLSEELEDDEPELPDGYHIGFKVGRNGAGFECYREKLFIGSRLGGKAEAIRFCIEHAEQLEARENCARNGHRNTGRNICAECGAFI